MQEIIAVKGGTQQHQSWRTDNIFPCLTASMGMGGGYVPMILSVSLCGADITPTGKHNNSLNRNSADIAIQ